MMKCKIMNIGERPIILFIFAYQIFYELENESNPKRAETPACEKDMRRGLPQVKKKMGGDSRKKKKRMAGTPARKKKENGGDSRKRKRNVYGGDSRN